MTLELQAKKTMTVAEFDLWIEELGNNDGVFRLLLASDFGKAFYQRLTQQSHKSHPLSGSWPALSGD